MLKLTTAAAAVVLGAGAVQAAVFDFEEFTHGQTVSSVSAGGITADITVDSNGAFDQAVAFDTSLTGTEDPDLEASFGGTGPSNPGKVLIISEDGGADDERRGGTITFTFDQLVTLNSFSAFDGARYEVTSLMGDVFLDDDDNVVTGDNLSNTFEVPGFEGVQTVNFLLFNAGEGASGAIDSIDVTPFDTVAPIPVPAALPLLMAGLGGLAFVGRRRKA